MGYRRYHEAAGRLEPCTIAHLASKPLSGSGILLLYLHVFQPSLFHLNPSLCIQELCLIVLRALQSSQYWPNSWIRSILRGMHLGQVQNGIGLNHLAHCGGLLCPRLFAIMQLCDSKSSLVGLIFRFIKFYFWGISITRS